MDTKMLSGLIQNWWQNFGRRIQSWDFQNCPNFHWIFEVFSPHVIGWNWLQSCAVWNFNLIILFGSNQRCLGESDVLILRVGWVFSWRFCSEGRKHSIVNGQSFRLPIETRRTENLSEMFHTILGYSSWTAKRRRRPPRLCSSEKLLCHNWVSKVPTQSRKSHNTKRHTICNKRTKTSKTLLLRVNVKLFRIYSWTTWQIFPKMVK